MIKGLGQQTASVRYNILTNTMDVAFLYILLPQYGIVGYYISFLVTHLLNFILSIRRLLCISGERITFSAPALTLASSALAVGIAQFAPTAFFKGASYLAILVCLLFLLKILDSEDLTWLKGLIIKK